jgi:integrase
LHLQNQSITLLDRITGKAERTVNDWCDEYIKWFGKHARMKLLRDGLGKYVLADLTPEQVSTWLDRWNDKTRMRMAMLSAAKVIFGEAIGKGWLGAGKNPAADLTTPTPKTTRQRLTLEQFKSIYEVADPRLQKAMRIMVITGLRPNDLLSLKRDQVKDGYLWIQPSKTKDSSGIKLRLPLSLSLSVLNLTLGGSISSCSTSILTSSIIHHTEHAGRAKPGSKMTVDALSGLFRDAREKIGLSGDDAPTLYEIRSLCARLMDAQGIDTKVLLGHTSDKMAALYKDSRGAEWVTLQA